MSRYPRHLGESDYDPYNHGEEPPDLEDVTQAVDTALGMLDEIRARKREANAAEYLADSRAEALDYLRSCGVPDDAI